MTTASSNRSRLLSLIYLLSVAAVYADENLVASTDTAGVNDKVENVEETSNERIIKGGFIHNLLLFLTLVAFVGNLAFMIYATFPDFKWKVFGR